MATWVRRLADTLAAGAGGLEHAIITSARAAPDALQTELTALAAATRVRGLEPALRSFANMLDDPAADRIVASLILRARAGGRGLVDVLDGLAVSLREEAVVRRQIEADRAKPRSNMRSIVVITTVVLAALMLFARDYLAPLSTIQGQLVLAIVAAIFTAAFLWMGQLSRGRRPARLLDGEGSHG